MKRKDLFLGLILCTPMIGLGHLYVGDKKRGFTLLGVQLILLVLSGIAAAFSNTLVTIAYLIFFGVGIWAAYDTVVTIKLINDNI